MPETNAQPALRPEPPQPRHARRWKRTTATALLLLVGGAIVNVAVAWGCSLLSGWQRPSWIEGPMGSIGTPREAPAFMERLHGSVIAANRGGSSSLGFAEFWIWDVDRTTWVVVVGWPAYTLAGSHRDWDQDTPTVQHEESGILRGVSDRLGRWIPSIPLWPGFIVNTLFYALLIWLIFFAPFAARRVLRRKRRLCEKCAYPVGTSPVCTECGAAVSQNEPRA